MAEPIHIDAAAGPYVRMALICAEIDRNDAGNFLGVRGLGNVARVPLGQLPARVRLFVVLSLVRGEDALPEAVDLALIDPLGETVSVETMPLVAVSLGSPLDAVIDLSEFEFEQFGLHWFAVIVRPDAPPLTMIPFFVLPPAIPTTIQ